MEREIRDEALVERVVEEGSEVFTLDWDSGAPGGGADTESVYEFGGEFYYISNSSGYYGPYESLDRALSEHEMPYITTATESVRCESLRDADLLARSQVADEVGVGHVIEVNGRGWAYRGAGRFEPVGEGADG